MHLRVTRFLVYHDHWGCPLDTRVERKLRSQPPWIQHTVIERGECTCHLAPSAIVMRRIIDLRVKYKLPREDDMEHLEYNCGLQPVTPIEEAWVHWVHTHGTHRLPVPGAPGGGDSLSPVLEIPEDSILQVRREIAVVLGRNNIPVPMAAEPLIQGVLSAAPVPTAPTPVDTPTPKDAQQGGQPVFGPLLVLPPPPPLPVMPPTAREVQAQKQNKAPRIQPAAAADPVAEATAQPMEVEGAAEPLGAEPVSTEEPMAHKDQAQKQNKAPLTHATATAEPMGAEPAGTAEPTGAGTAEPVGTVKPMGAVEPRARECPLQ